MAGLRSRAFSGSATKINVDSSVVMGAYTTKEQVSGILRNSRDIETLHLRPTWKRWQIQVLRRSAAVTSTYLHQPYKPSHGDRSASNAARNGVDAASSFITGIQKIPLSVKATVFADTLDTFSYNAIRGVQQTAQIEDSNTLLRVLKKDVNCQSFVSPQETPDMLSCAAGMTFTSRYWMPPGFHYPDWSILSSKLTNVKELKISHLILWLSKYSLTTSATNTFSESTSACHEWATAQILAKLTALLLLTIYCLLISTAGLTDFDVCFKEGVSTVVHFLISTWDKQWHLSFASRTNYKHLVENQ